MLIAGLLCVGAAALCVGFATRSLFNRRAVDSTQLALRALAPTQLAAAVMLAAGGVVALAATPRIALVVTIICVAGALGTLAAGSWRSARFALRTQAVPASCGGNCAICTQSCR